MLTAFVMNTCLFLFLGARQALHSRRRFKALLSPGPNLVKAGILYLAYSNFSLYLFLLV